MNPLSTSQKSRRTNIAMLLVSLCSITGVTHGQALNWEGQTGVFVTPLAYTVPSQDNNFGRPILAYHYLSGGEVVGGFHNVSVTIGALHRVEFGYTRTVHSQGNTAGLSELWGNGYNTFHGKWNGLQENIGNIRWVPAVSVGFVARTQVPNVVGVLQNKKTTNADFYAVATKTITASSRFPVVLNFGYKATNASILGIAGNAPAYVGRAFGAAAVAFKGPAGSTLMVGSEVLQQPREIDGLPGAVVPTTITYAVRIVPAGMAPSQHHGWGEEAPKFNIDIGIAQAAGNIMPGVALAARHQFALGLTYGF